jgi:pimeloyl-ACP methyl ester carboxylesterase
MDRKMETIVLLHGLWLASSSWHGFRRFYEERGYQVLTPVWPRMSASIGDIRRDPSALAGLGLREIADHYEKIVRSLDDAPILMGHSMGGLIVQILLNRGLGAAGVSIDGTAPRGVFRLPLSVIKAANPVLSNPLNYWRCKTLTFAQFKYAFANIMTEADARTVYERDVIPGPGRPIFEAAFANFNPWTAARINHANNRRAPLLLIAGAEDNLVPAILNRINHKLYQRATAKTDYKEFPNRSHLIVAQKGWQEVAAYALSWAQEVIGLNRHQSIMELVK